MADEYGVPRSQKESALRDVNKNDREARRRHAVAGTRPSANGPGPNRGGPKRCGSASPTGGPDSAVTRLTPAEFLAKFCTPFDCKDHHFTGPPGAQQPEG